VVSENYGSNSSIMAEDFNIILTNSEKKGGNIVCNTMRERMEDLISNWDLLDVKPIEGKHTWSNKRTGFGSMQLVWMGFSFIVISYFLITLTLLKLNLLLSLIISLFS
jgi:hypothetical protein